MVFEFVIILYVLCLLCVLLLHCYTFHIMFFPHYSFARITIIRRHSMHKNICIYMFSFSFLYSYLYYIQSSNQSINQAINQSINQSINLSFKHSWIHSSGQSSVNTCAYSFRHANSGKTTHTSGSHLYT